MAIYHYHREIGKRHHGKNAVFASAYIRAEKRACHRTEESVNFSDKEKVVYVDCVVPEDAPIWAKNLRHSKVKDERDGYVYDIAGENFSDYAWNQIELMEKRKDAQLYFHDDVAIPNELSEKVAIELVDEFVKAVLAKDGIFCDVAIHWDEENHHGHFIMPIRKMTNEGFAKKTRFAQGELTQEVKRIRAEWSEYTNRKLKEYGFDARIDHRSFKDRGLDLEPTRKIGKATYMHNTKQQQLLIAENQLIKSQNYERIKENPALLVAKVAQENIEFTDQDLKNELARYVVNDQVLNCIKGQEDSSRERLVRNIIEELQNDHSVLSERTLKKIVLASTETEHEFNKILDEVEKSAELINLGLGQDGRVHYVSQHSFQLENDICSFTEKLNGKNTYLVTDRIVKNVAKKHKLNKGQIQALKHATQGGNMALIVGYAGTGKTYMLKAAREVWEKCGYRVHGVGLSGTASAGLEKESGIKSKTIYRFINAVRDGYLKLGPKDIVVMDEMGMTPLDDMHQLLNITQSISAKFVGVGDIEQTQPVGRGAPMRAMIEQAGCMVMSDVLRQKVEWQRQATLALETQNTGVGLDAYKKHGCVHFEKTQAAAMNLIVDQWHKQVIQDGFDHVGQSVLISHKNETVTQLNQLARAKLVENQLLEKSIVIKTNKGSLNIAVGDRLLFGKNDYRLDLRNGDFVTVIAINDKQLTIKLDRTGQEKAFNIDEYKNIQYGYAATVHKMQGFTGDWAFKYIDSRGWDRHLFLVAGTRHRKGLTIVADYEQFENYKDLKQVVSRCGLKDHIFDYPVSFALRRGYESQNMIQRAVNFVRSTASTLHDGWLYLHNYQEYLLKQQGLENGEQYSEDEKLRRDAVIVADFCDNRAAIGERITKLETINLSKREKQQQKIYELQVINSHLARNIQKNYDRFSVAMSLNRISEKDIEKAVQFDDKKTIISKVINDYRLSQFYNPLLADEIYTDLKGYYGHIAASLSDKNELNLFITALRHMAVIRRYDTAFDKFEAERRADIGTIKRYLDLDNEVYQGIQALNDIKEQNKESVRKHAKENAKERLHQLSVARNQLADEIRSNTSLCDLIEHFGIEEDRLNQHANQELDRHLVEHFSKLTKSEVHAENLQKQLLAHRIKDEPKRYGIYISDFLDDGWKQVNLENWRFKRNQQINQSGRTFKKSFEKVKHYYEASYLARDAWQAAMKRRNTGSPNYKIFVKRAQGLSYHRDKIASELVNDMEHHAGALAFDKVDLAKLAQRARRYDYSHDRGQSLYYHQAQPIHYTLAEIYLRQGKGLVGADLSEIRFHSSIKLPDSDKTMPAIIIPIMNVKNKKNEIQTEKILYLNETGTEIVAEHINGDAKEGIIVAQKGKDTSTVYFADNIVDAKAISVAEPDANIFVSVDHYNDLKDITWAIKQSPELPGMVVVTTDNFLQSTEQDLYLKTQPLRDFGIQYVLMAKGKLNQNYTHISIAEALVRQESVYGSAFIQKKGIEKSVIEKTNFKDKLKNALDRTKKQLSTQEIITRPKKIKLREYYINLDATKLQVALDYFNSLDKLTQENTYKNAVKVAQCASKVYEQLHDEIRLINNYSQAIKRSNEIQYSDLLKSRLEQGKSIGMNDLAGFLDDVAQPKLDQESQKQLKTIVQLIKDRKYGDELKVAAKQFIKDRSELINLYKNDSNMPQGKHLVRIKDIINIKIDHLDRVSFLDVCKYAESVITEQKKQKRRLKHDRSQDDDRSRGGRSY